jgi:hypothetical protein
MSANHQYNDRCQKMQGESAKEIIFFGGHPPYDVDLQQLLDLLGSYWRKPSFARNTFFSTEMPAESSANIERNSPKERLPRAFLYANNVGDSANFLPPEDPVTVVECFKASDGKGRFRW